MVQTVLAGSLFSAAPEAPVGREPISPEQEVPAGRAKLAGLLFGGDSSAPSRAARSKAPSKRVRTPLIRSLHFPAACLQHAEALVPRISCHVMTTGKEPVVIRYQPRRHMQTAVVAV